VTLRRLTRLFPTRMLPTQLSLARLLRTGMQTTATRPPWQFDAVPVP
jgi:hypothetical protein